jgi:hypothetical protein
MLKKLVRGGVVASSKKMVPAMAGAVAAAAQKNMAPALGGAVAASKQIQPALGDASMKGAAPAMSNPSAYKAMQPTVEKAAVGAALQKKPVAKVLGRGLAGLIKRR